jgi:hypothetical protein
MHRLYFMQGIFKYFLFKNLILFLYLTRLDKSLLLFVVNDWSGFENVRWEFDKEYLFVDKNVGLADVGFKLDTNLS